MPDIDEVALRRLDLTVLLVFLGLMRHRKATDVAARMGLTQSAISHSLKRLRAAFDDPLFLRQPHGLEPTAVALALEPKLRLAVETLSAAMRGPEVFAPANAVGVVTIGTYDNAMAVLVPGLMQRLCLHAPGLRLIVRSLGRDAALQALEAGEIDLAFGYFWDLPEAFLSEPVYEESYRVVLRQGHPLLGAPWTPEIFAGARHVVVSPAGVLSGIVDRELRRLGLARHVAAAVPLFFPALVMVAQSDLLATLPARLVLAHAASFGLAVREPPLAIRPFPVAAVRHRRNARNGLQNWLIGQARDLSG